MTDQDPHTDRERPAGPSLPDPSGQTVQGAQTPIAGDVHGPVLSGEFKGLVLVGGTYIGAPAVTQSLHGLPSAPADFTGREAEIEDLLAHIDQGVAISGLRGLGGIGKTALALKLAERLKDRYPDAQFFIDLQGTQEPPLAPGDAMRQVARAVLGVKADLPDSDHELASLYHSVLDDQRALLILDNARDAAQVTPLLPPASCSVLITSRWHFPLPGLYARDLSALPESDAVALLLAIAPRVGEQAAALAQACGYLPLALRVAASALAQRVSLSVADYLQRLGDARRSRELSDVQASLSLSVSLLEPDLQARFAQLGVFPAPFDRPAAGAVWDDAAEADRTQDALDALVDFSFLDWNAETDRYRLHDLVRDEALARLSEEDHWQVSLRYATYYMDISAAANDLYLEGGEQVTAGLALFDREWPHIQAGHTWALTSISKPQAAQLVIEYPGASAYCLDLRLHARQRIEWLRAAVAAAREIGDHRGEAYALNNLGLASAALGETRHAIQLYEQSLVIAREIGDRQGEGNALNNLGLAYADLGEPRRAIELYEQALVIARENNDRRGIVSALNNLGAAYSDLGEPSRAISFYELAFGFARKIGDRRGEGNALGNLGNAYAALGETRRAIELYEQQFAIVREIGDRQGEGAALGNLGLAYADLGETRRAIDLYEQRLVIAREIDDRRGEGIALGNLGNAYVALGETRRAIDLYEQRLVIARGIDDRRGEAISLGNLGLAYVTLGEARRAIDLYEQNLVIAREIGDRRGEGKALDNLGLIYSGLGEPRRAIEYHEQALVIARVIGDRRGEAIASRNLGDELAKTGEKARAVELMQVYANYMVEVGLPDSENRLRIVDKLREKEPWTRRLSTWLRSLLVRSP